MPCPKHQMQEEEAALADPAVGQYRREWVAPEVVPDIGASKGSTLNSESQYTAAQRFHTERPVERSECMSPARPERPGLSDSQQMLIDTIRGANELNEFYGETGHNASGAGGGTKNDLEKADVSLIPYNITREEAFVLMHGANKYGRDNWMDGFDYSRLMRAAQEHLMAWWWVSDNDPETGLSHLAHARCMIDFLFENHLANVGLDNRPPRRMV